MRRRPALVRLSRFPARPRPPSACTKTPPLEVLHIPAEGGGIDSGANREIDERRSLGGADPDQEAELLGRQPERLEAGVVIARDGTRRRPNLKARTFRRDALQGFRIKPAHVCTLDNSLRE